MNTEEKIAQFFTSKSYGVVGASIHREKYGNKVLRCYLQHGKKAIPVNPNETSIENVTCFKSVVDLPFNVESISIITPPKITDKIITEVLKTATIKNVWIQPGAESATAIKRCEENGINIIADGTCILVILGFSEKK